MRSNRRNFNFNKLKNLYSNFLDNQLVIRVIEDYKGSYIFNIKTAKNEINKILEIKKIRKQPINKINEIKKMINKLEKIKKSNDETEIKNNKKNEQIKKINQEIEIKIKNSKYRAKLLKIQNTVKLQESKPKNKLEELLILKEQECKLHNLKCYEYPNLEVLDKLIASDLLYTIPFKKKYFGGFKMVTHDTEREQLEAYRARMDENGAIEIIYKKYSTIKYGRVYGNICAIALRKEIRGSLFCDKYVDLDVSNCHPNIYFQIAQLYKIECPQLKEYVTNRAGVFASLMEYYNCSKQVIKELIISLLYLGGFNNWAIEHNIKKAATPFIAEIRKELSTIANAILKKNPKLVESVKNKKKGEKMSSHKLLCCAISYFNQEIECRILEAIFEYCTLKEYIKDDICCLCFDGVMILKENYNESLLTEFSDVIMEKIGLSVKFERKEFDTVLDILDEHIKPKVIRNGITIDSRYLLDKDKLLNDDTPFVEQVKEFINNNDIKTLSIKSAYDTGKTQLIKSILRNNPQFKKILMVSYRITLTYELESVFEEFEFKNYKNGDYKAPRLINQTESLLRLIDNAILTPKYDLVIIDEVESVLNQFNSHTFKGNAPKAFELLEIICKTAGKIITLDGDIGDRSNNFVDHFGKSINIINLCKPIQNTLNILHKGKQALQQMENLIAKDLDENKKIVVCCMSATYALELKTKILTKYPEKKILLYLSTTADDEKKNIKNINSLWEDCDILMYTPTIEAGLSFDKENCFDRLYGYVCSNSTSQRAFYQMLSRVRKFKETEMYIYSDLSCDTYNGKRWTYKEIEESSVFKKDLALDYTYTYNDEEGAYNIIQHNIMKNKLFREIYNHNLLEEKNKNSSVFMQIFIEMGKKKGYKIKLEEYKQKQSKNTNMSERYLQIVEAENIDQKTYEIYISNQKNSISSTKEKLAIQKYIIMRQLGLDNLNFKCDKSKEKVYDIVKKYCNNSTIKNYMALIDEANISDKDILLKENKLIVVNYVSQILESLGFDHCCDEKIIDKDMFYKKCCKTSNLISKLSQDAQFNLLFNLSKDDLSYLAKKDLSSQMRKINTMLEKCGIKVSNITTNKKKGNGIYCLETIDHYDELVSLKIKKIKDATSKLPEPVCHISHVPANEKEKKEKYIKNAEAEKYYSKECFSHCKNEQLSLEWIFQGEQFNKVKYEKQKNNINSLFHDTHKIFKPVELDYFKEYIHTDARNKIDIDIDFGED